MREKRRGILNSWARGAACCKAGSSFGGAAVSRKSRRGRGGGVRRAFGGFADGPRDISGGSLSGGGGGRWAGRRSFESIKR